MVKLSLILLLVSKAHAFTLVSDPYIRGYKNPEVAIDYNQASCPAGLDLKRVLEDSVKVWNGVPTSSLKLKVGSSTSSTASTYPPTAYCDATMTGNTIGLGGSGYNLSTMYFTTGRIRLNNNSAEAGYIMNFPHKQIVVVVTHELGHLLGLGHSEITTAVMYFQLQNDRVATTLSQDDIDGITYLYPRDEFSGDQILGGCALVKTLPPPSGPSNGMLLFALLMPLAVWARLRSVGVRLLNK
jgi:hypothetical protein